MNFVKHLFYISGISNISRISKAGSSFYNKLDFSNNSESSLLLDTRSYISNGQKNDLRKNSETNKVLRGLHSCEESTCNYAKLKFIHECLEQLTQDQSCPLEKNTIQKLKKLLVVHEVKKYKNLPSSKVPEEEMSLLGIINLPKCEFNYEERLEIKSCLENRLREKMHSFITLYVLVF